MGLINRFYSVYLNLLLVDTTGKVLAISRPDKFPSAVGADVSSHYWFKGAMGTQRGDEYVADDIYNDTLHQNAPVAAYSTAVRKDGEINGKVLGVLGVFFDWGEQSRCIVQDEPTLTQDEWKRSRVLLLDSKHRVIAASDGKGLLMPYTLKANSKKGSYQDDDGTLIAYAKTIGYQEFDGLGWSAVIIQKP